MRVWDTWNVVQKTVVKPSLPKPGRVSVTMARYSNDGHLIVAGLANGSIQSWDVRGAPFGSSQTHPRCVCHVVSRQDLNHVKSCGAWQEVRYSEGIVRLMTANSPRWEVLTCEGGDAGKFGSSAAIRQVMPPTLQMVAKQDWRYVSGGGQVHLKAVLCLVPVACFRCACTQAVCMCMPLMGEAMAFRNDCLLIVRGSLQVLHGAHAKDSEVTSLAFSKDNHTLLSRAADDTLKVQPRPSLHAAIISGS